MFNSEDDNKEEVSFADAYKSQILNKDDDEETSSKNLIIIFLLVAIVIGLSVFGYLYMSKISKTEPQVETEKARVIKEVKEEEPPKSEMLNNIDELMDEEGTDNKDVAEPTKDIKNIDKNKKEAKNIKAETKPKPKQKGEETYLEQLAELSKEIDGETKKK